jgi:hypothetical protein
MTGPSHSGREACLAPARLPAREVTDLNREKAEGSLADDVRLAVILTREAQENCLP